MSRRSIRGWPTAWMLAFVVVATSCASRGKGGAREPAPRTDLLTAEELSAGHWRNAYDAVSSLRARWLQSRGPDTIMGKPGEVQVHLDDVRLGGVETLREILVIDIAYMQFLDPATASARWGLDHTHGAIYVSTRPR
jgi:hypothetical protein